MEKATRQLRDKGIEWETGNGASRQPGIEATEAQRNREEGRRVEGIGPVTLKTNGSPQRFGV